MARRNWLILGGVAALAAVLALAQAAGLAETVRHAATNALRQNVADDPRADETVAIVNGREIKRREISSALSSSKLAPGAKQLSPDEALATVVDQTLLAQAARAAGIEVTEEEADKMVAAATAPFKDGTIATEDFELVEQLSQATSGMTMEQAFDSPEYRQALVEMLRRGRYVQASGQDRETLLKQLRGEADIQVFWDRLADIPAR